MIPGSVAAELAKFESAKHRAARAETLRKADEQNGTSASWPEPEPLPDDLLPVPKLTSDLLPVALRDWLVDVEERMQCPLEFPSIAAIVAVASAVGNKVRIRPKRLDDWTVTPNLWGAIVGKPGILKTPALEDALRPLKARERLARDEYARATEDLQFKEMCAAAERKHLEEEIRVAVKKGEDVSCFRSRLQNVVAEQPIERRYIVNDPTVEKLGELLNQNTCGLLLFRDELVGWFRSLDKHGHEQDRSFYLEAWNGNGSYTYDRISRGTLRIDNLTVSILGGIQPGPLSQYLNATLRESYSDDGLMQRFQLLVYPDASITWCNVDRLPNRQAASLAHECFAKLDALTAISIDANVTVAENGTAFGYLNFEDEAQRFFDSWREDLEHMLRDGSLEHSALEAHLAKYRSLMPTLALLFHLLDIVGGNAKGNVSLESTKRAAAWCSFLEQHARRVYGLALMSDIRKAKTILGKIRRGQLKAEFTARDIYRKCWAGLSQSSEVTEPLQVLVDYGWLMPIAGGTTEQGGRSSVTYLVHPTLTRDSSGAEVSR